MLQEQQLVGMLLWEPQAAGAVMDEWVLQPGDQLPLLLAAAFSSSLIKT